MSGKVREFDHDWRVATLNEDQSGILLNFEIQKFRSAVFIRQNIISTHNIWKRFYDGIIDMMSLALSLIL